MDTGLECVCCSEYHLLVEDVRSLGESKSCILDHPGFRDICLSPWSLRHGNPLYIHKGRTNRKQLEGQPVHE